ncbi:MAG TPA: acylase [Longimicrobiales bacterium]|nr:acylase [Longimicrobiales bacterium]
MHIESAPVRLRIAMLALATNLLPRIAAVAALLLLGGCTLLERLMTPPAPPSEPVPVEAPPPILATDDPRVELLWDRYGVPHIFAGDETALFYAFGFAQMRSHADLLLRLYGQARGRAAEYWGEDFYESDVWVRTNGIPGRAQSWLADQSPHVGAYLDAFVAGMNTYAEQNADSIGAAWRQVLPVTTADVLAHQQRVLQFSFVANPGMVSALGRQWQDVPGSNAWAIGPARAASRNALLLANPHLPWGDLFTFYEAHLVAPNLDAYGATLVGFPVLAIAFNPHLGWTHTVNTIDGADLYEVRTTADGYMFDGAERDYEVEQQVVRVRQPDNTLVERPLTIRRTVHGPVVAERPDRVLALRVAGLDASQLTEQYWDMMRARNLGEFDVALSRLQLPMFTVMYADREGNIMHVFNGTVPVRPRGDWSYWQGIVPGDSSTTLWTTTHRYHELPRVLNPPSGWLQNANDPPWTTTIPFVLEPQFFPQYVAPQRPMSFRAQRSARMIAEDSRITFDELVASKHSTRMESADHLVQDLIAAAHATGDEHARAAADVLEGWDRTADAASRGGVLFANLYRALQRQRWPAGSMFEVPWTPTAPLATPDGLADPRTAVTIMSQVAQRVHSTYGALDIPWGDVHRLRRDSLDLPANGGGGELGIFRVVGYDPMRTDSTRFTASSGDSYVAAIEFATPIRARTLLTYGNASQPGSPHRTDQFVLFARKVLKQIWLTKEDVLANLSRRDAF